MYDESHPPREPSAPAVAPSLARAPFTRAALPKTSLSRREALALLGSSVALVACGSDDDAESAVQAARPAGSTGAESIGNWARGGTANLASGSYRDPFITSTGGSCSLTCRETIGPCYASTLERSDISEGYPGLPVRLSLLVVDESCTPVAGATVDIWHTRNTGTYSGSDTGLGLDGQPLMLGPPPGAPAPGAAPADAAPAGAPLPPAGAPPPPGAPPPGAAFSCSLGDADAEAHQFFRGTQTTDATGRVHFDTCYPGWYTGRALHIHFIVRRDGRESVTSQLYFPEELTRELCASHPDYMAAGQPDTTNTSDGLFSGEEHVLETEKQPDGALLAYKTLVIRSSLDTELCGTDVLFAAPPAAG
jgi:protocatechuate 3,4-dioxygenase beta subunit